MRSFSTTSKAISRFWKKVSVQPWAEGGGGGYAVFLDNRPLRIKGEGLTCCFPNRITAEAAAWEWQTVGPGGLSNPQAFPVTSLASRIQTGFETPAQKESVVMNSLAFLRHDSLCNQQDFPQSLQSLQEKHYQPVLKWAKESLGLDLLVTVNQIMGPQQTPETMQKCRDILMNASKAELAGVEVASLWSKSLILSLAFAKGGVDLRQMLDASNVERTAQIQLWGFFKEAHGLEWELMRNHYAAISLFLHHHHHHHPSHPFSL